MYRNGLKDKRLDHLLFKTEYDIVALSPLFENLAKKQAIVPKTVYCKLSGSKMSPTIPSKTGHCHLVSTQKRDKNRDTSQCGDVRGCHNDVTPRNVTILCSRDNQVGGGCDDATKGYTPLPLSTHSYTLVILIHYCNYRSKV